MDFSKAFQNIQGSVVNVLALNAQNIPVSSGSGVIIGSGNLVLTCAHCIIPNTTTIARFSGANNGQIATVVFQDQQSDIALLQFQQPIGSPAVIRSSSSVLIGHEAFVVGFPNNIDKITALSANIAGFEPDNGFELIRLDASVNHGNSGGPLFNANGELVGIVNAKHGSLSNFLHQVQSAQPGAMVSIGGIDPVKAIQQLISEMQRNLNLGIGYAIPTDHIGTLNNQVQGLIQP
ncbi:S1 family peptidase [Alteromonas sp. CYL-A6]|uniref:S1 family peptidase n=1 Tax=Alteromonas nitratireducens TaxID=3390813 RepID=UPI0034C14D1A